MISLLRLSLIDGDYIHVVKLVELLLANESETVSKAVVMSELGVSEYILNKALRELEVELDACFDKTTYQIFEDKDGIELRSVYGLSKQMFIAHLLKKSHCYNMFIQIGFNKFSINDYAEKHFISPSKVYKELGRLKNVLKQFGITINKKNQLDGNEMTIRSLLLNCQPIVDKDHVRYDRHKLMAIVKKHYEADIHYNLINTLSLTIEFISCRREWSTLERIDGSQLPIHNTKPEFLKDLQEFICDKTRLAPDVAEREALILASYTELSLNPITSVMLTNQVSKEPINHFLDEFLQAFPTVSATELACLEADVTRIVCRACHPIAPDFESYIDRDVSYFEELYPEFFNFLFTYIQDNGGGVYEHKAHYFFYSYMLSLIANINLKELFDEIVICIDFNEDLDYLKLIKKNLESISSVNVRLTTEYQRSVAVVITDMPELYEDCQCLKLIWKVPPGPAEWKILGNTLVHLRKQKYINQKSAS